MEVLTSAEPFEPLPYPSRVSASKPHSLPMPLKNLASPSAGTPSSTTAIADRLAHPLPVTSETLALASSSALTNSEADDPTCTDGDSDDVESHAANGGEKGRTLVSGQPKRTTAPDHVREDSESPLNLLAFTTTTTTATPTTPSDSTRAQSSVAVAPAPLFMMNTNTNSGCHVPQQEQKRQPLDENILRQRPVPLLSATFSSDAKSVFHTNPTDLDTTATASITTSSAFAKRLLSQQQHQPPSLASASSISTSGQTSPDSSTSPGTPNSERYQNIRASSSVLSTTTTATTTTTRRRKVRRPTFEARTSRLDAETLNKNQDPFRGFHNLLWIVMGAYGAITFNEEWTKVGRLFGGTLFTSFSQDAIMLALSDLGLVLSTTVAFVLTKAVAKGWIRYAGPGLVIQHCYQVLFLLIAVAWSVWREWPWVQSGFFTLHAITMLMKIHSYATYNGELSEKKRRLQEAESEYGQLKKQETETLDDSDHVVDQSVDAPLFAAVDDTETCSTTSSSPSESTDNAAAAAQHHRRASEAAAALLLNSGKINKGECTLSPSEASVQATVLALEMEELRAELKTTNGELWPANVTLANWCDYLIVPSLIYELQYPRTKGIRPMYVFEKSVATLGTFTLLYLTTEHYIYPVIFDPSISPARALVHLTIPFMMNYLMIFYIIFECICNAFAELSCYADRNFYDDWWNSLGFEEWARKWNKPVHHFLLRHVYDSSIENLQMSKSNAAFATFLLSSCVHELVMIVVTRKFRLYLFVLQMGQLPLMWIGNHRIIRSRPTLANYFFWICMMCGPPVLGVAYCYA